MLARVIDGPAGDGVTAGGKTAGGEGDTASAFRAKSLKFGRREHDRSKD
jgi:hypothetical protein